MFPRERPRRVLVQARLRARVSLCACGLRVIDRSWAAPVLHEDEPQRCVPKRLKPRGAQSSGAADGDANSVSFDIVWCVSWTYCFLRLIVQSLVNRTKSRRVTDFARFVPCPVTHISGLYHRSGIGILRRPTSRGRDLITSIERIDAQATLHN